LLQGEYGLSDIYVGVPCILGANGIEQILELELSVEEQDALHRSAKEVQEGLDGLRQIGLL